MWGRSVGGNVGENRRELGFMGSRVRSGRGRGEDVGEPGRKSIWRRAES